MKIIYTTGDALWMAENGKTVKLPSYRETQYRETIRQISESKAWKTSGRGAQFMGVAEVQQRPEDAEVRFGGVALYEDGFLYTITLDASGGIYKRGLDKTCEAEGHIVSGNDIRPGAIAVHGEDVCVAMAYPNGQRHLGLYRLPRTWCTDLTDGESVENEPSWSPDGKRLYFSTCGIARGGGLLYSPASAAVYHVESGQMETLLEDDKTDYRAPKEDSAGNLYFIRQPYRQKEEESVSFLDVLGDVLLFPYRLVKAILGFLNVFSIMFGKEPLQSGGVNRDVRSKQKSDKELLFDELQIEADKNLKENTRIGDKFPGLLPQSRVLVKRAPDGTEEVLAKSVLDYCLCADGVVYSNGSHILHRSEDGTVTEIAKARMAVRMQAVES